jgi:hypothetical protein
MNENLLAAYFSQLQLLGRWAARRFGVGPEFLAVTSAF